MKRILSGAALACAALALAAAACAPAANENAGRAADAGTPAAPAATPAATVPEAELVALEQRLWDALKRKDFDAFAAQLADDHVYVAGDGVYTKPQLLDSLRKISFSEVQLADFRVVRVGPEAAIVTYTADARGTFDGQPLPARPERDSTAWVRRGGQWLAVYHQDTYADEAGARDTAAPSANAAAPTPSPAAPPPPTSSPAGAGADDPEALERQVWDALRRKDYAAFAALLDDGAIEVEPGGVYTKSQTLEGVQRFDLSRAELSDFRQLKLNPDAALVTYTVKGPRDAFGPGGARHTTVWHTRAGTRRAIFHHGTPIEQ